MTESNLGIDLYRVLGVTPDASSEDIARVYRRLARRYHPDVNTSPNAAEQFARITHAYQVLSKPTTRRRYDANRVARRSATESRAMPRRTRGRSDQSAWTTMWPHAADSAQPQQPFWLGGPSFTRASGADRHAAAQSKPAEDAEEAEVQISLEEAYLGSVRTVTVTGQRIAETAHVAIPPGAITGDRIPVPLRHLPGERDPAPVHLRVQVLPLPGYRLDGRDVHFDLPVTPWEAALGATLPVETPAGQLTIHVPAGTSTGHVVTLPGQGLPNPRGTPGNLYAHVHIVVPTQLTRAERDLFTRLATASTFNPRATPTP